MRNIDPEGIILKFCCIVGVAFFFYLAYTMFKAPQPQLPACAICSILGIMSAHAFFSISIWKQHGN